VILPYGRANLTKNDLRRWKGSGKSIQPGNTVVGKAMFERDFKEFIGLLNGNKIDWYA